METINKKMGQRSYNHVIKSDGWEEDIPLRDVPTVCPDCGETLTQLCDLNVYNGWFDTHGASVKCEQCEYQEWQVIDTPNKRR